MSLQHLGHQSVDRAPDRGDLLKNRQPSAEAEDCMLIVSFDNILYTIPQYRTMPHTIKSKKQLLTRVRRIKGQAEALEKVLEQETECVAVLQQIAADRRAHV